MADNDPVDEQDVALLRTLERTDLGLPARDGELLAALAARLTPIVTLPAAARGPALQREIKRPDVELVRAAAAVCERRTAGDEGLAGQLGMLARKLTAYLPPKNGG
jgi:hypothetical protein